MISVKTSSSTYILETIVSYEDETNEGRDLLLRREVHLG